MDDVTKRRLEIGVISRTKDLLKIFCARRSKRGRQKYTRLFSLSHNAGSLHQSPFDINESEQAGLVTAKPYEDYLKEYAERCPKRSETVWMES